MSNSLLLFVVLVFALTDFALGLLAAAFFGRGPLRFSSAVRFLSDPYIPPPAFLRRRQPTTDSAAEPPTAETPTAGTATGDP